MGINKKSYMLGLLKENPEIGVVNGLGAWVMGFMNFSLPFIQWLAVFAGCIVAVLTAYVKCDESLDKYKRRRAERLKEKLDALK